MRRAKAQRPGQVGRTSQHGTAGGGVDDDGEVPRHERDVGSHGPSRGPMVEAEAELGEAVEDAAGEAVGKELALAVELRCDPDGWPPAQETALRAWSDMGGDAVLIHMWGRGRRGEESGRRHADMGYDAGDGTGVATGGRRVRG